MYHWSSYQWSRDDSLVRDVDYQKLQAILLTVLGTLYEGKGEWFTSGTSIWVDTCEYARPALGIKVKTYLSCIANSQVKSKGGLQSN